jgi:Na+/proline symporter
VVRDVVRPLSGKPLNPANERRLGRLVVIALITILTVLAFLPQARGSIILLASKGTGSALLLMVPLCGPLFWERASKVGATASLAVGGVVLFSLESKLIEISVPFNFGPPIVAFICQAPTFVIGSLMAPKDENGIGFSDSPKNEE